MYLIWKILILLTITTAAYAQDGKLLVDVKKQFALAAAQYQGMLLTHPDSTKFPQSVKPDGSPDDRTSDWWCSGFFAGILWHIYEYTGDVKWKIAADKWTRAVEKEKYNKATHDLGFMLYCSFGNAYQITKNISYKEPLLTGANSLASRFDPAYGVIRSWDHHADCNYPVIIDNMMNLELLLWAGREMKNKKLHDIAVEHANNTLKNHFRNDFSSYHVVCYESGGKVFRKKTHQGAFDSSCWARGEGWALYGFTLMYRFTRHKKYLHQAEGIADFIISHPNLPQDKIPYWDFNAPKIPNEERDASAAAIYASALLELSAYSRGNKKKYFAFAEQILQSLSSDAYSAKAGQNNYFILKHSVGHKPAGTEIDTPIIYADYYYLEALLRYNKLKGKMKSIHVAHDN